jgi:hypothetical protein
MDERIPAPEPSETALPDPEQVPMPTWVTPVLSLAALALVPWTLWLTFSLPMQRVAHNYDIAWVGFDVALLAAFAATSWAAYHGSHWLVPLAAVLGTMLICDAWFDVVTAHGGGERLESVLSATFAELPLAAICVYIVYDAEQFRTSTVVRYKATVRRIRGR